MVPFAPLSETVSSQEVGATRRRRWWAGLLPAAAVAAIAVWEMIAVARAGHDVPGDAAWARAAELVRARYQPGDLIVFAPGWIDPVGRMHLGDLIPIEAAARMDADRFGTIWELSIRGARAADTAGLTAESVDEVDGVSVRRFVREPVEVVTDFVAAFTPDKVEGKRGGPVGPVLAEVGFAPHRCVQVEPAADRTVTVTYRGVRLGRELVFAVGLADVFTRRDIRDPGQLRVSIDGVEVAMVTAGVDDGWLRRRVATTPSDAAEVVFAATAVGPMARDRLICFAAEARR
jgi:hypothetical protein